MSRIVFVVLCALVACGPPMGEPVLELTLTPRNVTDATPVKVRVVGTRADGTVGTGTVKITSARGSLTTPVDVQLDSFGSATTDLICDPTAEPECAQPVRVVGEWTSDGVATSAEARLNSGSIGGGPGGGGGTTGGGTGGGTASSARTPHYIGEVYKFGFLLGYSFHEIVPGSRVNQPRILVPANSNTWSAGPGGRVYYVTTNPREAFEAVPEQLKDWAIGTPFQNDPKITSPCGMGAMDLAQFLVFPDTGEQTFVCVDPASSSAPVRMPASQRVHTLGWNRNFIAHTQLTGGALELWRDGNKVADLPAPMGATSRITAVSDGFLVNAGCEVSKVDFTGAVTPLGNFTGSPPATGTNHPSECCRATVGPDLKGYVITYDNAVIGSCELSGVNTDLFTPPSMPTSPTDVPAQDWPAVPPVVPPSFLGSGTIMVL